MQSIITTKSKPINHRNVTKQTSKQVNDSVQAAEWDTQFAAFASKMRQANVPEAVIRTFHYYYTQLLRGATGYVPATEAQPVYDLPAVDDLGAYQTAGQAALARMAVIKLNGGLGTTMGMQGPKSLIDVKAGLTFLDIIVRQILTMRREHAVRLPLVLMNSFNTQTQSRATLKTYRDFQQDVPLDFLQHKTPKIWQDDLTPVSWPDDPAKEWCPPGHGDIYLALQTSGVLQQLLAQGYEYAFVSNADNLGATVDLSILGYFASEKLPFLMEVAERTPADSKGGHLACSATGGLLLREVAQCPPEELAAFQDIQRYCYFNTNNLWIHLPSLKQILDRQQGVLGLPLIRNEKPVDPTQPDSRRVYQLETAMGHAIALFPEAQAVQVTRNRFLPVKNTNDLLALWSDAYVLNDDYTITLNPVRQGKQAPLIDLDKNYYGLFDQLKAHFPHAVPSLVHCDQLSVKGDIYFDDEIVLEGDVVLEHYGEEPLVLSHHATERILQP
ncbi:MAG: UTP--glucose-1-phosphate uridylyltransferase [Chloroflexi bacterium]|nr:UTP--glucose-1-phosphate uridylyltransferase [Chloroflexota bacterium]